MRWKNTNKEKSMKKFMLVLVSLAFVACTQTEAPAPAKTNPTPAVKAPEPPKEEPIGARILKVSNLPDAFTMAKPFMEDVQDDLNRGQLLLAIWANKYMTLWMVKVQQNETSFAKVMKDSESERGKILCVRGRIVEIFVEQYENVGKLAEGSLMTGSGNVYRFIAVRSTGDLVERNTATFCGVVTGRESYANAGGGTTHGISMVGVFDIPENR
jgi:hypothetical protein